MTEYKMVPVEPTPEIRRAILARFTGIPAHYADAIWTAALPLPPPAPVASDLPWRRRHTHHKSKKRESPSIEHVALPSARRLC